jgi:nucleoside-diphosphate-sugar epimerase
VSRIFVTGGSGFVGRRLVPHLVAQGHEVKALARSAEARNAVSAAGAEPADGDLHDGAALRRAMKGCSHVIHAAADMARASDYKAMHRANVEGTNAVLEAAREVGTVRRFLFLGAAASIAGKKTVRRADESWPLEELSYFPYAATKSIADRAARAANAPRFDVFVLRPGWIWGPGDKRIAGIVSAARAGKMMWIDGGNYPIVTSHIGNVCHAVSLALERAKGGEAYFVFDDDEIVLRDWMTRILATYDLPPPTKSIPYGFAWFMATVMDAAGKISGRSFPISRAFVRLTGQEFTISTDKVRRELGYASVVSRDAGLSELGASLRTIGRERIPATPSQAGAAIEAAAASIVVHPADSSE